MTDKITVELDLKHARDLLLAVTHGAAPRKDTEEGVAAAIKAALPPEWEEGTLAWVTRRDRDHPSVALFSNGKWRSQVGGPFYENVTKVEPIRVLKDDEVAVKRVNSLATPHILRCFADDLDDNLDEARQAFPIFARIVRAYADALEAEK